MNKPKFVCLVVVVALLAPPVLHVAGSGVTFDRETIRILVAGETVRVTGTYVFTNRSPTARVQDLYYPFPVDSMHPFPHDIAVHAADSVSFRTVESGILFSIDVPPDGEATVDVIYEQRCLDNTACYILTSTAAWQRPLEAADFEITVPDSLNLAWTAYRVDRVDVVAGARIHRIARTHFMPEKDLCLRWERLSRDATGKAP